MSSFIVKPVNVFDTIQKLECDEKIFKKYNLKKFNYDEKVEI